MSRRAAVVGLGCLVALASAAEAAHVAEVRVGRHPGFTRLVLELDEPAGYRLEEPEAGSTGLRVAVEAQSPPRTLTPRDPLVREVRVEPARHGSEILIELSTPEVHVTEMILGGPPRIVLDLRRVEGKPEVRTEPSAATEPPAEPPEPAEREAPPGDPAAEPIVAVGKAAAPADAREPEAAQSAEPVVEPAAKPTAETPPGPAGGEEPPPAAAPTPLVAGGEPTSKPEPPAASAPPARSARADEAGAEPGSLRRNLGRILIGIGIGILLLVWLRLRSRAREEEAVEPPLLEGTASAPSFPAAEAEGEPPPPDTASPPEPPPAESPAFETAPPEPVAPPPAPGPPTAAGADGLEGRLAQLERRLEDLLESRERIERQIAAHTEELRVQRAAIARTQRVVRSLNRPESLASEPVPRTPERRSE